MGVYSWKYCDSRGRMICGKNKPSYLLIPKEFGGGHYVAAVYDGYGRIGNAVIYEKVAEWNKDYLSKDNISVPDRDHYDASVEGDWAYMKEMDRYYDSIDRLDWFISGMSHKYMVERFGEDYLRLIGIDIACNDEDNARLKYPIKIAENSNSVYENCRMSFKDPMQGCY